MAKHILDGPRKVDNDGHFERFTKLDRAASGKLSPQSEKLIREPRTRKPGEKLRRFAEIQRRED